MRDEPDTVSFHHPSFREGELDRLKQEVFGGGKHNPYIKKSLWHKSFEAGWCDMDMTIMSVEDLPEGDYT